MAVRALIVEDSLPTRMILKRRLEQVGCEVVGEAADALEGLNLYRSLSPQLVTLDLMMPLNQGMDARSLFGTIRKESPDIAIIIISAQSKAAQRAEFIGAGAIDYFEKPFIDAQSLVEKLERVFPELKKNRPRGVSRRL